MSAAVDYSEIIKKNVETGKVNDLVNENEQKSCSAKSLQLCLTLCNPIDGSPPGSPVTGILQARTLEWVAISFSRTKEQDLSKQKQNKNLVCIKQSTAMKGKP